MKNLNDKLDRVESELIDKVETLEKEIEDTRANSNQLRDRVYELKEEVKFLRKVIDFLVTPQED